MFDPIMSITAKLAVDHLKEKGVKAQVKISRYQTSIRAAEVHTSIPLDLFLQEADIKGSISDLTREEELAVSGRYKAKLITINEQSGKLNKGDKFYLVNTLTDKGTLKNKALAPEKLGIVGKEYKSLDAFDRDIEKGIENLNVEDNVKRVAHLLYQTVASGGTSFSSELKTLFSTLKDGDIKVLGKDFGEILSLRHIASKSHFVKFYLPTSLNTPLIDFYVVENRKGAEVPVAYSAKFEEGGAPSIKSLTSTIENLYKSPTPLQKQAVEVLQTLGSSQRTITSARILQVASTINLAGYSQLKTIIGRQPTVDNIKAFVGAIAQKHNNVQGRITEFNSTFASYYNAIDKKVTEPSLKLVFAGKTYPKFHSPIISPLGYKLVDYMNSTPIYQEVLNNASRTSSVLQIYLNFSTDSLSFRVKSFQEGAFRFEYGANAKDSDNTGIKFSMLRK